LKETIFGKTKPHAFSWLVWGILQVAVFFASTSKGGGTGAWAIGATAVLDFVIFGISLFKGEKEITRLDKTSLIVALLGMGLWVVTTDPIWSVLIDNGLHLRRHVIRHIPFRPASGKHNDLPVPRFNSHFKRHLCYDGYLQEKRQSKAPATKI
jgi:hypothetical protein